MIKSLYLLTVATLVTALFASALAFQGNLTNTKWRLVSFSREGREVPVVNGATITLSFDANFRVSGSGGCNSYGGAYKTSAHRVTFSQIFSTQRACVDSKLNIQEQQYFAALRSTGDFQLSETELHISYDDNRATLNFTRDSADPPSASANEEPTSPESALVAFFDAINNRNYDRAFKSWETAPSDLPTFKRGYADTKNVRLLVGLPVQVEGAAGSLFADVSIILVSQLQNGRQRIFSGCYTMRKSNLSREDNPNATGWRIYRASVSAQQDLSRASEMLPHLCRN